MSAGFTNPDRFPGGLLFGFDQLLTGFADVTVPGPVDIEVAGESGLRGLDRGDTAGRAAPAGASGPGVGEVLGGFGLFSDCQIGRACQMVCVQDPR